MCEGFTLRQLSKLSGHSICTLRRIKDSWLIITPPNVSKDLSSHRFLVFDGTYFHKDGCLITVMDAQTQQIVSADYTDRESYMSVRMILTSLKRKGLSPSVVTMDGHQYVIRAIKETWPHITIQRCLYHIQREGLRWLRTYPKTQAGKDLKALLCSLSSIRTTKESRRFKNGFTQWINHHDAFVRALPRTTVAFKDLKRTKVLITNALPDMFHYLKEPQIPSTTNKLEGFYSRMKSQYRRHNGMTKEHRIGYLKWYCYLKSQ